jgi:uncharacterized protein YbjT (DUF2867 family)
VVLGATGLVGGHCLDLLLADYTYAYVVVLARRKAPFENPKLRWHVVDFDRPAASAHLLKTDDVFCCLGTTIRAAGSREAFLRVDFGYVAEAARAAAMVNLAKAGPGGVNVFESDRIVSLAAARAPS